MMNYTETVEWLFQQFPSYQNIGANAYKPDLFNVEKLCSLFDNPQTNQTFIHVAGTNGKGSTSSLIASCLTESGKTVGLFTSPHIKSFTERIRINGEEIEENFIVEFVRKVRKAQLDYQPSFFELSFVLCLTYFRHKKTDVNIIETGLGGRLDATNIIQPILSVITNIGLEHTQFLGNTLALIATEKAGIIKSNIPVVIGEFQKETYPIFEQIAQKKNAKIIVCNQLNTNFDTNLLIGDYLKKNARTAYTALEVLDQNYFFGKNCYQHFQKGIENLKQNTGLIGRMQVVSTKPYTVFDAAHNAEGIVSLLANINKLSFKKIHIVYGTSADKDLQAIGKLFPKHAQYYFTTFKNKRSTSIEILKTLAEKNKLTAKFFLNAKAGLQNAQNSANEEDIILVFGSFFLLHDLF